MSVSSTTAGEMMPGGIPVDTVNLCASGASHNSQFNPF